MTSFIQALCKRKIHRIQNNYALPLAFAVNKDVASWSSKDALNPFEAQNNWFEKATGVSDVLKQVDISNVTYSNLSTFSDMQLSVGLLAYSKTLQALRRALRRR